MDRELTEREATQEGRSLGCAFLIVASLWLMTLTGFVSFLWVEASEGDAGCELPGADSTYGKAAWHWVPPGVTCTWTRDELGHPIHRSSSPSAWRLLPVGVLATWSVVVITFGRRWIRSLSRRARQYFLE